MFGALANQAWLAAPSAVDHAAVKAPARHTSLGVAADVPWAVSGGRTPRCCWVCALAVQAPVLLMDEPWLIWDPPHQADWLAVVQGLRAGVTVVSVLHEISMALHADRVVVMALGACRSRKPAATRYARGADSVLISVLPSMPLRGTGWRSLRGALKYSGSGAASKVAQAGRYENP